MKSGDKLKSLDERIGLLDRRVYQLECDHPLDSTVFVNGPYDWYYERCNSCGFEEKMFYDEWILSEGNHLELVSLKAEHDLVTHIGLR